MADLRYGPEPVFGSCADGNPETFCQLVVNTTLYPALLVDLGPVWEQVASRGTQWFTFVLSVLMTGWFVYNFYTGHCGWEVIFVTTIEFIKIIIELFYEYETPCMIYSVFGPVTSWLRYIEWLLTCPVILIHLSNLTGLDEEYSARTMGLLTSDQGTICFGITSALSRHGLIKIITFLVALCFGVSTFYSASRVYIESYHQVPKGLCRKLVRYLTTMFFCSWLMFPLLFLAGPEGMVYLTWSGSTIGHTVADLMSKNIWGLIAHYLQVKIREHIILHGDVRAKVEKTVAGHTFEVEGFRDEGDDDAEAVSESKLDRRNSFQLIAARLEKKGEQVKLGRKGEMGDDDSEMGDSMKNPAMAGMPINPMPGITAVQGGGGGFGGGGGQMDPQQQMQMMMQMMQMQQQQQQQQSPQSIQQNMMGGMPQQQQNMMGGMPQQQMIGGMDGMGGMGSGGMQMGGSPSPSGQLSPGQMSPGGTNMGGQNMGMMGMQPGMQNMGNYNQPGMYNMGNYNQPM
uniref:Uncharacterized protein n=2 Tax=Tetraselmis TaxID=3164 RepID=A0A7S1X318_9CHLO|nr:cation channelrhodopsin 3 [Tetraselmis subcordiformis]|mmetsp:Transcript_23853/g.42448  ORF Transcript_23853/g.42448 Transcript_23853/m.42448 type:complete len:512 (+) Transcript_23853:205-1740(+)